jgi:hypothetical protein
MNKLAIISLVGSFVLAGAGCDSRVPAATASKTPSAQSSTLEEHLSFIRGGLAAAGVTAYTESNEASDVSKMKSAALISAANKFKFSGGNGSVRLLVVTVSLPADLVAVKTEIKAQYDQLQTLSDSARISWLAGDPTHVTVVNWKVGDEAFANQIIAALGGTLTAIDTAERLPATAAETSLPADIEKEASAKNIFKTGDKVKSRWKGGVRWWDATVIATSGDEVTVKYADGIVEVLPPLFVAHLNQPNSTIKAGQEVLAKWSDGNYYAGFVTTFDDESVMVKWKDGSAPSKVPYASVEMPGR